MYYFWRVFWKEIVYKLIRFMLIISLKTETKEITLKMFYDHGKLWSMVWNLKKVFICVKKVFIKSFLVKTYFTAKHSTSSNHLIHKWVNCKILGQGWFNCKVLGVKCPKRRREHRFRKIQSIFCILVLCFFVKVL